MLECPSCAGRKRVIAAILQPGIIAAILRCLGLARGPIHRRRGRYRTPLAGARKGENRVCSSYPPRDSARERAGPVPNLVDVLHEIDVPALVLLGEHDANLLPRAVRIELAGAGHVLNLDQPEAFVREVERFIPSAGSGL